MRFSKQKGILVLPVYDGERQTENKKRQKQRKTLWLGKISGISSNGKF